MKKNLFMDCQVVLDIAYEAEKEGTIPLLIQAKMWTHLLFCTKCAMEIRNLRHVEEIMKTDFFPPAPDFGEKLMEKVLVETDINKEPCTQAASSLKLWVVIGFFVLLSLSSAFFGVHFTQIAKSEGMSFLLPIGLTVGMVVTCYGALFIGSHLKELTNRFRLR